MGKYFLGLIFIFHFVTIQASKNKNVKIDLDKLKPSKLIACIFPCGTIEVGTYTYDRFTLLPGTDADRAKKFCKEIGKRIRNKEIQIDQKESIYYSSHIKDSILNFDKDEKIDACNPPEKEKAMHFIPLGFTNECRIQGQQKNK